ncbi:MAG: hypothetical protein ACK4SY_04540 [Pyrobaculum sp.]
MYLRYHKPFIEAGGGVKEVGVECMVCRKVVGRDTSGVGTSPY